ncbi:uncharacterized protein LOC115631288 [Scaptodrosophila lebanonensis]|uniref:Uncharacterized protein LOC115631288 n=1 Tax=Drosophila lebanonensis TaxID=7225 RepID=A0A6J2U9K8_DROLE|nr:uncharacterized protein LOC115631288 [Scaptodrosophila lebanonensis]
MCRSIATLFFQRTWCWLFSTPDFYGSIRLLISIAYFLGITPFHVARDPNGMRSLRDCWIGFVNVIAHWLLLSYCYTYIFLQNESLIGYFMRTYISEFTTRLHEIGGLTATIITFMMTIFRRRHLKKACELIVRIDRCLDQLQQSVAYTNMLRYVLVVLSLLAFLDGAMIVTCVVCLRQLRVRASWQLCFVIVYEMLAISITICFFCLLMRSIQRRFGRINKEFGKETGPSTESSHRKKRAVEKEANNEEEPNLQADADADEEPQNGSF